MNERVRGNFIWSGGNNLLVIYSIIPSYARTQQGCAKIPYLVLAAVTNLELFLNLPRS